MNRVFIFIISREMPNNDLAELKQAGETFVTGWTAHDNRLFAEFDIVAGRIIVVKVNENLSAASGCSIDKLNRFIKETGSRFGVDLLNRLLVAYRDHEGRLQVAHNSQISDMLASGQINEDTLVYNTAAADEKAFQTWEQPLKATWLKKYLHKV